MWLHHGPVKRLVVGGITALVASTAVQAADKLFVDEDAAPGGNGLTWGTAYRFLQDALVEAAASGGAVNEIRVAQGTYVPDRDEAHPNGGLSNCCEANGGLGCDDAECEATVCAQIEDCCLIEWDLFCAALAEDLCGDLCESRAATFQLLNGVAIMGGFAGPGAADPDERDVEVYETTLSGDLAGNDDPDSFPFGATFDDNSYHVVVGSATDATAVLDGFTVTAGIANGPTTAQKRGGGMWIISGSPIVRECTFDRNAVVSGYGGGLACSGSNITPLMQNCTFRENIAAGGAYRTGAGGGLACLSLSSPTIDTCTFTNNIAQVGPAGHTGWGGGLVSHTASPTIEGCTFSQNEATGGPFQQTGLGGGMALYASNVTVENCTFIENTAIGEVTRETGTGGGIYIVGGAPTLTGCTFSGNMAIGGTFPLSGKGGGMWSTVSSPILTNCTFSGNVASAGPDPEAGGGGGFGCSERSDTMTLVNCLFTGNTASGEGGGLYAVSLFTGPKPTLINCTFTGNAAGGGCGGIYSSGELGGTPPPAATRHDDGELQRRSGRVGRQREHRRRPAVRHRRRSAPVARLTLHRCREECGNVRGHRSRGQPPLCQRPVRHRLPVRAGMRRPTDRGHGGV
jgi:hypothetical protein